MNGAGRGAVLSWSKGKIVERQLRDVAADFSRERSSSEQRQGRDGGADVRGQPLPLRSCALLFGSGPVSMSSFSNVMMTCAPARRVVMMCDPRSARGMVRRGRIVEQFSLGDDLHLIRRDERSLRRRSCPAQRFDGVADELETSGCASDAG